MTDRCTLRVASYNLQEGGLDSDGSDARWHAQMGILADEIAPDLVLIQEANGWLDHGGWRLHATEAALGMRAILQPAPSGFHTAVLFGPRLHPRRTRATHTRLAWHALAAVEFDADGLDAPITAASVHLSPFSPEYRLIEAQLLTPFARPGTYAVVAGDFNALAAGDPAYDLTRLTPNTRVHRTPPAPPEQPPTVDRRVGELLARAGFVDAAPAFEASWRHTPTAGFAHAPYRPDQIQLSPALAPALRDYHVVDTHTTRTASDHLPIQADLDLTAVAPAQGGQARHVPEGLPGDG